MTFAIAFDIELSTSAFEENLVHLQAPETSERWRSRTRVRDPGRFRSPVSPTSESCDSVGHGSKRCCRRRSREVGPGSDL